MFFWWALSISYHERIVNNVTYMRYVLTESTCITRKPAGCCHVFFMFVERHNRTVSVASSSWLHKQTEPRPAANACVLICFFRKNEQADSTIQNSFIIGSEEAILEPSKISVSDSKLLSRSLEFREHLGNQWKCVVESHSVSPWPFYPLPTSPISVVFGSLKRLYPQDCTLYTVVNHTLWFMATLCWCRKSIVFINPVYTCDINKYKTQTQSDFLSHRC